MQGKKHRIIAAAVTAMGMAAAILLSGRLVRAAEEETEEAVPPVIQLLLPDAGNAQAEEILQEGDVQIHTLIYREPQYIQIRITDPELELSRTELVYRIGPGDGESERLSFETLFDPETGDVWQEEEVTAANWEITDGMSVRELCVHAETADGGIFEYSADSETEAWEILVDETPPEVRLLPAQEAVDMVENAAGEEVPLYAGETQYLLRVEDPANTGNEMQESGDCAGMEKVEWYVQSDLPETVAAAPVPDIPKGSRQGSWTIPVRMEEAAESNDIQLVVSVTDRAGNRTLLTQNLAIDRKGPRITIRYDNNDVQNGIYFNAERNLTVRAEDLNFDPSQTILYTETAFSGWQWDGSAYTAVLNCEADGEYLFHLTAADLAGNPADVDWDGPEGNAAPQRFVVDRTAPVIQVSFDRNDAENGKYYNKVRTAAVRIAEENFTPEDVKITIEADLEENDAKPPQPEAFHLENGAYVSKIRFDRDGEYRMRVQYQDPAGNPADPVSVPAFVIDRTPPKMILQNMDGGHIFGGHRQPVVLIDDTNLDAQNCRIAGSVSRIGGTAPLQPEELADVSFTGTGKEFFLREPADLPSGDGHYLLSVTARDLAGNVGSLEEIAYPVNRFGSVYMIADKATEELLSRGYTKNAPELSVIEYNPEELVRYDVTLMANGAVRTLAEGREYTVSDERTATGWMQYQYRICPAAFQDDRGNPVQGNYEITVFSEDAAGNRNSNRTNALDNRLLLTCLLDREPPVGYMDVTGLKAGSRELASPPVQASVYWEDNIGMSKVTVFLNGKAVKILEGEELARQGGAFRLMIREKDLPGELYAVLTDLAGNETELPHRLIHQETETAAEESRKQEAAEEEREEGQKEQPEKAGFVSKEEMVQAMTESAETSNAAENASLPVWRVVLPVCIAAVAVLLWVLRRKKRN